APRTSPVTQSATPARSPWRAAPPTKSSNLEDHKLSPQITRRHRRPLARPDKDAGITLVEVVVALSIMAFAMTMFTTGILQVFRAQNKTDSASNAQTRVNLAFLRLDKELRYSSDVSSPGKYNSVNWRVEYLITNSGTAECNQLQLDVASGELQHRTWTQ